MTLNETYATTNSAKASFFDHYTAPTPHAYLTEMRKLGYQIAQQATPYLAAAAELVAEANPAWPVQMLDVGCSYGIGSAFVRHGCSFEELVSFFDSRAPQDYAECVAATRAWLGITRPAMDMRVVGLDASANAIRFGLDAGLLDGGLACDLEQTQLDATGKAWVRGCNMLICTGAIGYVGRQTFRKVLTELGRDNPGKCGPVAILTVLRMFDEAPIAEEFARADWHFTKIRGARLPQRAFASRSEQAEVVAKLQARGLDTAQWESQGVLYADLYAAAPGGEHQSLVERLSRVKEGLSDPLFRTHVEVATIKSPPVQGVRRDRSLSRASR